MDTFFATKKGGQLTHGHMCCQLFVMDKGFLYVMPMQRKSEVLQAIKQFAKEIGVPTSIITDMASEQMSQEVRKFCNNIGTTLWALEEGTPWSNIAELYIGLLKEAVRKDMRESNSPMSLWDYCVERRARINNLTSKDNLSCMEQCLILQPWLSRVTYPPFANLVGMSGATIMNRPLPFLTIVKYLEESWALPEVKTMRWPNGFSKPPGRLCPDDHYNH